MSFSLDDTASCWTRRLDLHFNNAVSGAVGPSIQNLIYEQELAVVETTLRTRSGVHRNRSS